MKQEVEFDQEVFNLGKTKERNPRIRNPMKMKTDIYEVKLFAETEGNFCLNVSSFLAWTTF